MSTLILRFCTQECTHVLATQKHITHCTIDDSLVSEGFKLKRHMHHSAAQMIYNADAGLCHIWQQQQKEIEIYCIFRYWSFASSSVLPRHVLQISQHLNMPRNCCRL